LRAEFGSKYRLSFLARRICIPLKIIMYQANTENRASTTRMTRASMVAVTTQIAKFGLGS